MARGRKMDRRGSGPAFFIMLVVVVYSLYSVTVAWATVEDCDGSQHWSFFPPEWVCESRPGFG